MSHITLSKSAVDRLIDDPKLRQWRQGDGGRVPVLRYFRRSYSTSHAGTVTEHGDGFSLTTIDPASAKETTGIMLKSVAVADGLHILVGADESMMSRSFAIGWVKKFTYEPLVSP